MTLIFRTLLFALFLGLSSGCSKEVDTAAPVVETEVQTPVAVVSATPLAILPEGLKWLTNTEDLAFADPAAKKGGTFRTSMMSFPLTLRLHGPDANGSFAGMLRALQMGLLDMHPNSMNFIPSLATHWAFGEDQKTVYYKLDPDARWSDGRPVTADDYLYTFEFRRSKHILEPYSQDYFTTQLTDISKFDDYTIAITAGTAKPRDELLATTVIGPTPRHFHRLSENWVQEYNWKIAPTTAAYKIDKVKKGKYIEFRRLDNWWAKDKKFYKNRFNVDKMRVKVIRDRNIAWSHFLKGDLEAFSIVKPTWNQKAKGEAFDNGYIQKITFFNDIPRPSFGLWLNTAMKPLDDINVRIGLAYAVNVEKAISTIYRGDFERLETQHVGYGDYTNPNIKPRPFDIPKADHYFNQAGWSAYDENGIRSKQGQRLSLDINYGNPDNTKFLVVLKEEAKKAGVELNLKLIDSSAAFKQLREKKHQIAYTGWAERGISPGFWEHYHSDLVKPQTNNINSLSDPDVDMLIDRYRAELSRDKRIELAHQLEQKIHDLAVMIPSIKTSFIREAYWAWVKLPSFNGNKRNRALVASDAVLREGLFWLDTQKKKTVLAAKKAGKALPVSNIIDDTWKKQ